MTNTCYSDTNEEKSLQLLGDCLHILENQFETGGRDIEDKCGCGTYKCQVLREALWCVNQYQQEGKKKMVSKFVEDAVKFRGPMSTMSTCRSVTDTHEFHHNISVVGSDLESEGYISPLHKTVQPDGNHNEELLLELETIHKEFPKESGPKESVVNKSGPKESVVNESGPKNSDVKESTSKEPFVNESIPKESITKETVVNETVPKEPIKIAGLGNDQGFSIDRSKFSYKFSHIPATPIIIPSFLRSSKPNGDQKSQPIPVTPIVLPGGTKVTPSAGLVNKWPSTIALSKPVPLNPPTGWTPGNYWSSQVGTPLWRVL